MSSIHLPSSMLTGGVALPARAASEVRAENAELMVQHEQVRGITDHFNRELRQIDPDLQLVLAKPHTTVLGLRPGYWHLIRYSPGHPAYIKTIETPDGQYKDPDSSIFTEAAEDDLWSDQQQRARWKRTQRAEDARARQVDRERQDRVDEMNDRYRSATGTQILVK